MNVGIGTVPAQFLFREYLFQIFGIMSLQCVMGLQRRVVVGLQRGDVYCVRGHSGGF
jgi:hypothetical protein